MLAHQDFTTGLRVWGLRRGFLRAWLFTVFKVMLIASLLHGYNIAYVLEANIGLLDQYVRNDFAVTSENAIISRRIKPTGEIASAHINALSQPAKPQFGQVEIPQGIDQFQIVYRQKFLKPPVVILTPRVKVGVGYWIEQEDSTGFTIKLEEGLHKDLLFNWYAF